jgi:hypothetical protein
LFDAEMQLFPRQQVQQHDTSWGLMLHHQDCMWDSSKHLCHDASRQQQL